MTRAAPEPGDVIADYEIIEKVGGNMGLVFKARHRLINKVVALKLLPVEWMNDAARLARFQREIRIMGPLEHPNLVTASDARRIDPWHLVAMEWIDGFDLLQLVRMQGPLPMAIACEAARQAALGLDYAHQHGLVHRDIKPSNLMLSRSGIIKVIDMGLARENDESTGQLTQPGDVMGTLGYCAPEQFTDATNVDIRADIYSLGCTFYHLLVGRAPYAARKSAPELMHAHMHEAFPSLSKSRGDIPTLLEEIVAGMTCKDRAGRFASPKEIVAALEPFSRQADLKSFVAAADASVQPVVSDTGKTPLKPNKSKSANEDRPAKRGPLLATAVCSMLLGVAITLFLRNTGGKVQGQADVVAKENQKVAQVSPTFGKPVLVLVDTTADRAVYDAENRGKGITNAEELEKVLRDLPLHAIHKEPISINWIYTDWTGESRVLDHKPNLVIIHRSSFFHPLNAQFGLGYPPFTNELAWTRWEILYRVSDAMLISFMGNIASASPETKFLVYSRGTDTNWLTQVYRDNWVSEAGERIPSLKDRLEVMMIPNGTNGTFKDRSGVTQKEIRHLVKSILKLPE